MTVGLAEWHGRRVYWKDHGTEAPHIILVVHGAVQEVAHWLYVQEMLESLAGFEGSRRSGHVNIRLSKNSIVNEQAIERFREFKRVILSQTAGVRHHG